MNRRGAGNIEVLLAFLLFIGAIVSALFLLNPVRTAGIGETDVGYVFDVIQKSAFSDVESYSIKLIDLPPSANAVSILLDPKTATNNKIAVEDYFGRSIPYQKSARIIFQKPENNFVIVRFSKDIDMNPSTFVDPAAVNYEIASQLTEKLVSESKFLNLNKSYYESYETLSSDLKIPIGIDFSAKLLIPGREIILSRGNVENRNVISKIVVVKVLRNDGSIIFANLEVAVWNK